MLPILRLIPVGGVSLAILLLILALNPPSDSHGPVPVVLAPARGPLLTRFEHPEWRQLLIHAALRRAEELGALRLLPDSPPSGETPAPDKAKTETAKPALDVAGVPANHDASDAQGVTGSIMQPPDHTIPIDIGETSSTELPVIPQDEQPPVIMMPERSKPPEQSMNKLPVPAAPPAALRRKTARPHRVGAADAAKPASFNLLQALFGSFGANGTPDKNGR